MIHPERIQMLSEKPVRPGRYVLYWMQASQRAQCNHALEYAIREANRLKLPLVVFFGLTENFPEANLRHYTFMVEGLQDVHETLRMRGIRFVVRRASPEKEILDLAGEASVLVTDRGYLRIQRAWREEAAKKIACPMVQIETDVVVPVERAMEREAYSAAVLRPRINKQLDRFLVPLKETKVTRSSLGLKLASLNMKEPVKVILCPLSLDRTVSCVRSIEGGYREAKRRLDSFVPSKLKHYDEQGNDPTGDGASGLSAYLHFGHISPLEIALAVRSAKGAPLKSKEAFLEELIVRRELSMNFVLYNPRYDDLASLPDWAKKTLEKHARDKRPYRYNRAELEEARTHDPYWNAAQKEMVLTGRMHNYMRMYWGKKILEWSGSAEEAYLTALYLNNKYELDGRDPSGYAGVAWCFGKHDRPWNERDIFGTVRYMNDTGLRRKFKMDRYVQKIQNL